MIDWFFFFKILFSQGCSSWNAVSRIEAFGSQVHDLAHYRHKQETHYFEIDKMIIRTSLTVETIVKSYMYIRMMTELTSFNYFETFYHEWEHKVLCYTISFMVTKLNCTRIDLALLYNFVNFFIGELSLA